MHRRLLGAWLVAVLAAGCGDSSDPTGDAGTNDAGRREDSGLVAEPCGAVTCDPGMVCCNASCGICTAPGEGCTAIECLPDGGPDAGPPVCGGTTCADGEVCCPDCTGAMACTTGPVCPDINCEGCEADGTVCGATEYCDYTPNTCGGVGTCTPRPEICTADCPGVCGCDGADYCNACNAASGGVDIASEGPCGATSSCDPMDATGEGFCDLFLGYAWDGSSCQSINCRCVGTECDALYGTIEECEAAHADCGGGGTVCGGFLGTPCADTEYCDYPMDAFCGFADGTGTCRPRPTSCAGEPSMPVCGCDGTTYTNACEANLVGVDVQRAGSCTL